MHLLKSHAMRAKPAHTTKDPRLLQADQEYLEWLKAQEGEGQCFVNHPAVLMKARRLQGSIDFRGLPVSIETGRSRNRQWFDPHNKTQGISRMPLPYGYIKGTRGTDGDQLDIIVGPDREAPLVYVFHIQKAPSFQEYDEDKCFVGIRTPEEALRYFRMMYDNPRFFGSVSIWPFEEFKEAVFNRKGERLDNTRWIPPEETPNGMTGPGRLFTEAELREWALPLRLRHRDDLKKSGEAICKQIGDAMGIDWQKYSLDEFCNGMFHEQEHGDVVEGDQEKIARIVLEHLDEDPEYYSHFQEAKDAGIIKDLSDREE